MTLVIVCAGIDLSVGSVLAFVSVAVAWFLREQYSPWIAGIEPSRRSMAA